MPAFATVATTTIAPHERTEKNLRYIFVPRFCLEGESLRAQFEWKIALSRIRGKNLLGEMAEEGICRMWSATADRIFTQDAITGFLSHLRRWARGAIGISHASSPQIQVFSRDCWRAANQDSTPAKWRYIYVLGPKSGQGSSSATLMPLQAIRDKGFFSITRTINIDLTFGGILVYAADFGLSIDGLRNASDDPLCGIVLLTGYLW